MRRSRRAGLHPSLRLKLTLAFAAAMALLLTGLGLFIYARFQAGLDASLNQGLRSRTNDVQALVKQADTGLAEAGGARLSRAGAGFAQVLKPGGKVLDQTPGLARKPLLTAPQIASAGSRPLLITTTIAGLADPVRLLATPVRAQDMALVAVVGVSLQNRAVALRDLRDLMLLGGPVALLLTSLLGYAVSALSLRSVEAMRRQATRISVTEPGRPLPVPPAQDELRRLALTLNEMIDRDQAAFARERRFVADASHELRAPLAVLKTELEVALTGDSSKHELHAALESANAEADRVAHVARDLLTLAQADENRLPIAPAQLRVSELLERVRQRFIARAHASHRTLVVSAPGEMAVYADPLRVEQALSNLVDNALRHGAGAVTLFAESHSATAELHVADNGPGFPEGFLAVAFERFSRPDAGRSAEGTGLGLSIVRSIARAHGGEAHIANRAGEGADAWMTLPRSVDATVDAGGGTRTPKAVKPPAPKAGVSTNSTTPARRIQATESRARPGR
jgi:two-component system OmpR family sensor kinase